ncbi:MAG: phospho-sugar mutase [Spirochaetes bacterium]|nr:phospho-sugar mutase [Spirochaetota bacterium]
MDSIIQSRIDEWTKKPFLPDTINEINELMKNKNEKELIDRFYTNLEFGTGGLRGIIGAGTNRINIYTIGMTTQGLANYILSKNKADKGVVIARDSRRMSDVFAKEAASILTGNGIIVYFFDDITPTPLCSFAIRWLGTVSGIVITASHNPPKYNGYKVYWDDGGQVIPPYDKEIIEQVKLIDSIVKIKKMDFEIGIKTGKIKILKNEISNSYINKLEKTAFRDKSESSIKIVYTPLHGTGYKIIPDTLKHFGFSNIHIVNEQAKPDGNFPTVKYPNPEEKGALALSLKLAEMTDADIIMATDPDADRIGIGFKDNDNNYILINGNQIGVMLEYYLLTRLKETNKIPLNGAIIKTIVTTDLQEEIAENFNCKTENVLTGFKWIAKKMKEYDETGDRTFIFGGEESFGYLPVNFVRDKDAVSACYFFAEMADWLSKKGTNLYDFLNQIYINFKVYLEDLHSLTLKGLNGMEKINKIMEEFRLNPPGEFAGFNVKRIADIETLKQNDLILKQEKSIKLPKSNVLQFFLDKGAKLTMRPSGTEPKIKFYFSINEKADTSNIEEIKLKLREQIELLKNDLISKVEKI